MKNIVAKSKEIVKNVIEELQNQEPILIHDKEKLISNNSNGKTRRKLNVKIKQIPSIYFIYDEFSQMVYIGQTNDLQNRLANHKSQEYGSHFVYVKYLKTSENKRFRIGLEYLLINFFRPKYNMIGVFT